MDSAEWMEIHDYCMAKPCAYESRPFGELPICYRVAGKIFAQLFVKEDWFKITLKTNPEVAGFYRKLFPDVVVRGWHCPPVQQPYWNTISLNRFEKEQLWEMIDEAYEEIIAKLTKKERARLPELAKLTFVKTDGVHPDFIRLCECLDQNLGGLVGAKIDRSQYTAYNQLDNIHDVIVIYREGEAIAGGAYRLYDEETVEIKRVYLRPDFRGRGVGKELLRRLEADARIKGFRYAVLETGELLEEAVGLDKKFGYKVIPNYGPYVDMPQSLCMKKKL